MPIVSAPSFGVRIFYRQGLPVVSTIFFCWIFFQPWVRMIQFHLCILFLKWVLQPPTKGSIGTKTSRSFVCRCRSRNCGTVEKLKKYVGKSPSFFFGKELGVRKHKKKHHRKHQILIVTDFFQRSLLCKIGGGGKQNWMWFVGEDKISSCKEARGVWRSTPFFCFPKFCYQLHLCEWMA